MAAAVQQTAVRRPLSQRHGRGRTGRGAQRAVRVCDWGGRWCEWTVVHSHMCLCAYVCVCAHVCMCACVCACTLHCSWWFQSQSSCSPCHHTLRCCTHDNNIVELWEELKRLAVHANEIRCWRSAKLQQPAAPASKSVRGVGVRLSVSLSPSLSLCLSVSLSLCLSVSLCLWGVGARKAWCACDASRLLGQTLGGWGCRRACTQRGKAAAQVPLRTREECLAIRSPAEPCAHTALQRQWCRPQAQAPAAQREAKMSSHVMLADNKRGLTSASSTNTTDT